MEGVRKTWKKKWDRGSLKLLKTFEKAEVRSTRWSCSDTMRLMGIEEDVYSLLRGMDLGSVGTMSPATYEIPTIHFISSLQEEETEHGENQFTFMIQEERFRFSIKDFCDSLDINDKGRNKYPTFKGYKEEIWKHIANPPVEIGKVRVSKVRNPAIRYTLHLLANTVFARKEGSRVENQEIHLLYRALGDHFSNGVDFRSVNNGMVIMRWMLKLRNRLKTSEQPTLCFGGILTPLFVKLGVDLSKHAEVGNIQKVDVAWLSNAKSCGGLTSRGCYIHKLGPRYVAGVNLPTYIALPLAERVKPHTMENIEFRFTDLPAASRGREESDDDSY